MASQSSQSSQKIVLNMTEGTFFSYNGEDYERIVKSLFEKDYFGTSRWLRTDKIIFVPDNLKEYVVRTYERIL